MYDHGFGMPETVLRESDVRVFEMMAELFPGLGVYAMASTGATTAVPSPHWKRPLHIDHIISRLMLLRCDTGIWISNACENLPPATGKATAKH
jgi:hypothetical protein